LTPRPACSIQESLSTLEDEVALELYTSQDSGAAQTLEYRKFLQAEGAPASYWHDVPLRTPSGAMRAVIEITRETRAKMEIATDEAGTPIKQDVKKGKLRDYNIPIKWNYGALPQVMAG
jgi:inorganic pyrophosphatase